MKTLAASITLAVTLGVAGTAFGQQPTPDPAPVPAPAPAPPPAPAPEPTTASPASTPDAPATAKPVRNKKKRAAARTHASAGTVEEAAPVARHPRLAEAGPTDLAPSGAPEASPVPVGHAPPVLGASESDWPGQAALLFLFTIGLLSLVLALAPARLLVSISAGLPRRRQDLGFALALIMALGAGFFVVLVAV